MKPLCILAAAALLACTGALAQQAGKKSPPPLGASKDTGHGRSVANDRQQVEADKFQMRQDKANKDTRSYKKHERQMQRDQERVNTR
jgi:hypothetical protein